MPYRLPAQPWAGKPHRETLQAPQRRPSPPAAPAGPASTLGVRQPHLCGVVPDGKAVQEHQLLVALAAIVDGHLPPRRRHRAPQAHQADGVAAAAQGAAPAAAAAGNSLAQRRCCRRDSPIAGGGRGMVAKVQACRDGGPQATEQCRVCRGRLSLARHCTVTNGPSGARPRFPSARRSWWATRLEQCPPAPQRRPRGPV